MRVQIASDLHHELERGERSEHALARAPDADLMILAGDIHSGTAAIGWYRGLPVPVVYVHGNHEAYNQRYPRLVAEMRQAAAGTSVVFLQNSEVRYGSVRILGTCLWSENNRVARHNGGERELWRAITDYRAITRDDGQALSPEDIAGHHRDAVIWLERQLATPFAGKTIVVTHHAPSFRSIPIKYRDHPLAAFYASELEHLVVQADLWLHGHVHASSDYTIGSCRVLCNPRGYFGRSRTSADARYQNENFNQRFLIEI